MINASLLFFSQALSSHWNVGGGTFHAAACPSMADLAIVYLILTFCICETFPYWCKVAMCFMHIR